MILVTKVCVCVFFFPFILDVKFVGCTSRGHTGETSNRIFLIHLPSAVMSLFFRGKDSAIPFPRREVELCVLTIKSFSSCWAFFFFVVRKNSCYRDPNSRPNVSEGYEVTN